MEFSVSEEQTAIADLAAQIFADKVTHEYLRDQALTDEVMDEDLWRTIAEAGLLGVALNPSYGGSGLGLLELGSVLQAQGCYLAPLPLLEGFLVALTLQQFAGQDVQKNYLPKFISGESLLTLALESDGVVAEKSDNKQSDNHWVLHGEYPWVPLAATAAAILVVARSEAGAEIFLLPAGTRGCETVPGRNTTGQQGYQLSLKHVRLTDDDRLSKSIAGAEILEWIRQRQWTLQAALQLGALEEALKRTAAYTLERKQFGKPIASFQAVSHRAANGYIDIEVLKSVYWQAAWRLSDGREAAQQCRLAKWWLAEAGHRVSHSVQHLHGGIGSDLDYPIHRYFLWAKQQEFAGGSAAQVLAQQGALLAEESEG